VVDPVGFDSDGSLLTSFVIPNRRLNIVNPIDGIDEGGVYIYGVIWRRDSDE